MKPLLTLRGKNGSFTAFRAFFIFRSIFLCEDESFRNRDPPLTRVLEGPLSREHKNTFVQASDTVQKWTFSKPFFKFLIKVKIEMEAPAIVYSIFDRK